MDKAKVIDVEARKLMPDYDKIKLHNSVTLALRRRKVPVTMLGYDLMKGIIFGKIRHPEKSVEECISNSVKACSLPCAIESFEDGMEHIIELLETVMDIHCNKTEGMTDLQIVELVVTNVVEDIRKEYCYEKALKLLKVESNRIETLAQSLLKDMLFKKLVADNSTWECMYEYALRKLQEIDDSETTIDDVKRIAFEAVPEGYTLENYVDSLVEKAYE